MLTLELKVRIFSKSQHFLGLTQKKHKVALISLKMFLCGKSLALPCRISGPCCTVWLDLGSENLGTFLTWFAQETQCLRSGQAAAPGFRSFVSRCNYTNRKSTYILIKTEALRDRRFFWQVRESCEVGRPAAGLPVLGRACTPVQGHPSSRGLFTYASCFI